ncbi:MAG TPA: hypothetical protein VHF25_13115 [Nitriliruptorales bacterium]|nr:hypothetical protein [Nitriliruptorales bacterium]
MAGVEEMWARSLPQLRKPRAARRIDLILTFALSVGAFEARVSKKASS